MAAIESTLSVGSNLADDCEPINTDPKAIIAKIVKIIIMILYFLIISLILLSIRRPVPRLFFEIY